MTFDDFKAYELNLLEGEMGRGHIDLEMIPLLNHVNAHVDFVTLFCCAGHNEPKRNKNANLTVALRTKSFSEVATRLELLLPPKQLGLVEIGLHARFGLSDTLNHSFGNTYEIRFRTASLRKVPSVDERVAILQKAFDTVVAIIPQTVHFWESI